MASTTSGYDAGVELMARRCASRYPLGSLASFEVDADDHGRRTGSERVLRHALTPLADDHLTGLSCLADGADQIFAQIVLDLGGDLEVIIPAENYRAGLPPLCHPTYDALLARAAKIYRLPAVESTSEAHMRASTHMLDHCDHLIAVWDGKPARGFGGTADVVAYARQQDKPVTIVWPRGAARG